MRVKMSFVGGVLDLFLQMLVMVVLFYLFIIPGAWGYAMFFSFVANNTRLSDGSTVAFLGKGGEIWWLLLLLLLVMFVPLVVMIPFAAMQNPHEPPGPGFAIGMVLSYLIIIIASLYIGLKLFCWVMDSIQFSWGGRLSLQIGMLGLLGWMILMYLSFFLIIAWAWVVPPYLRWIFNNTSSTTGDRLIWNGTGGEVLWRTIVFYLGCLFVIPIPWVTHWFLTWFISQVEIERPLATAPLAAPARRAVGKVTAW